MQICLAVYLRPEVKFDGFQALIAQINADIADGHFIMESAAAEGSAYKDLKEAAGGRMAEQSDQNRPTASFFDWK